MHERNAALLGLVSSVRMTGSKRNEKKWKKAESLCSFNTDRQSGGLCNVGVETVAAERVPCSPHFLVEPLILSKLFQCRS